MNDSQEQPSSHHAPVEEKRTRALEHSHSPESIARRLANDRNGNYLKDAIYGAIDGAVTTFAVVSGVAGADLSASIIVILGVANLVGDGFSMAAGNFLGTRAENQQIERFRQIERRHIAVDPEGEKEEVRQILASEGFHGKLLNLAVDAVAEDEDRWVDVMLRGEYGTAGGAKPALPAAATTLVSFIVVGSIPLSPFLAQLWLPTPPKPFLVSSVLTGVAFFIVGAVKSRFVPQHWFAAALETLAVGSAAAALAYLCGHLLKGVVS